MSTFGGVMKEYKECSLDRFDGVNLQSTAFFLSHCHQDHMVGLQSDNFKYRLATNQKFKLYCSPITKHLLTNDARYKHLKPHIVALEVSSSDGTVKHDLDIINPTMGKKKYTVEVTLLQAGHCPGSVMFLFEGHEGAVLYTGDFRLSRSDFMNMEALHCGDSPLHLTSIYMDTTFCEPRAVYIPTRAESARAASDVASEWLALSPDHNVLVAHKAGLGYEHLYREMAAELGMKVHVSTSKYAEYECLPDRDTWCTTDPDATRLHACKWKDYGRGAGPLPCGGRSQSGAPVQLRTIRPSTMAFVHHVGLQHISKRRSESLYQVCYSFHSSYSEIRDILEYLKPARAFANVIPLGEQHKQIERRLAGFLQASKLAKKPTPSQEVRPLGKLKLRKRRYQEPSQSDSDLDFGDSPPKELKRPKVTKKEQPSPSPVINETGQFEFSCLASESEDEVDVIDLTLDSQESLENFSPVQNGSLGEFCSYCSDDEEDSDVEIVGEVKGKKDEDREDSEVGEGEKDEDEEYCEIVREVKGEKHEDNKDSADSEIGEGEEDEEEDSEVLVHLSDNKENSRQLTVCEVKTFSFVSEDIGGFGKWSIPDSQSLQLYLDGASDDAEDVVSSSQKEPSVKSGKDSQETGKGDEKRNGLESLKNGDIKTTDTQESVDKGKEAEKSEKEEEKMEEKEPQDESSKDDVDKETVKDDEKSEATKDNTDKEQNDDDKSEATKEDKESDSEASMELESEAVPGTSELELESPTKSDSESKSESRKRPRSEEGSESAEPPSKKPTEDPNSSDVIMLDSDDSEEEEEEESEEEEELSEDEEEEEFDPDDEEAKMEYIAKQQRLIQKMLAAKKRPSGPIDLTGDTDDEEEEDSEMDSDELEALAEEEEESMDEEEWEMAYQQLRRLRREESRKKSAPPSSSDCVIVVDSSDEDEEEESQDGDKKEEEKEKGTEAKSKQDKEDESEEEEGEDAEEKMEEKDAEKKEQENEDVEKKEEEDKDIEKKEEEDKDVEKKEEEEKDAKEENDDEDKDAEKKEDENEKDTDALESVEKPDDEGEKGQEKKEEDDTSAETKDGAKDESENTEAPKDSSEEVSEAKDTSSGIEKDMSDTDKTNGESTQTSEKKDSETDNPEEKQSGDNIDDLLDEDDILKSDDEAGKADTDMTTAEIEAMLDEDEDADKESKVKGTTDEEGKDSAIEDTEELSEVL